MTVRSDADLLGRIRLGDEQAWSQLIEKHERRLSAIARARGLSQDAVHDALQGTWLKLLDHADRIREPEALGGWLATVVRNEAILVSKRRHRERERAERLARHTRVDVEPVDVDVVLDDDLAQMRVSLAKLSMRCQELLRLVFAPTDLSYAEIAEVLGVPIGSLGPTRARCLNKLRSLMRER